MKEQPEAQVYVTLERELPTQQLPCRLMIFLTPGSSSWDCYNKFSFICLSLFECSYYLTTKRTLIITGGQKGKKKYQIDWVWNKSFCSIWWSKQKQSHRKATVHKMSCSSTQQQAPCAFVGALWQPVPQLGLGRLCAFLSHSGDHSNLTAEANESHSWGWDAFACFSNGENPAGFFTQVLGKVHSRKLVFRVKNNYWKLSRGHFQKHNVHSRRDTGSCEQKPLNVHLPLKINFTSAEIKLPSLSSASTSMTWPSSLSLFWIFSATCHGCLPSLFYQKDKHSVDRIQVKFTSRSAKVHSIVPHTQNILQEKCLRT